MYSLGYAHPSSSLNAATAGVTLTPLLAERQSDDGEVRRSVLWKNRCVLLVKATFPFRVGSLVGGLATCCRERTKRNAPTEIIQH